MLLKYFCFDCDTAVEGDYVINITKDTCWWCSAKLKLLTTAPAVPNPPTSWYVTDSNWWAYDCGNPILWWTASTTSWVTYTISEWATVLASWVTWTTYTVLWATVGSHIYTVTAVSSWWSSTPLTINTNVVACLSAPWNVSWTINVYDSGTLTNYTCWTWFDVDFTDVATATYYQLFEWATQIGSNSSTSNFVVTWQSVWSHTYTIYACNWAWCSTWTNFSVTINICGPTPLLSNTITWPLNLIQSGNVNNSILFDLVSNAHNPITWGQSIYNPTGTWCRRAKVTLNVVWYNFSWWLSWTPSIFMEITWINWWVETRTNLTDVPNWYSWSQEKYRAEHILPWLVDPSYNQTMVFEVTANDFLDMWLSGIIYIGGMVVPPDAYLDLTIGSWSKFEIFAC